MCLRQTGLDGSRAGEVYEGWSVEPLEVPLRTSSSCARLRERGAPNTHGVVGPVLTVCVPEAVGGSSPGDLWWCEVSTESVVTFVESRRRCESSALFCLFRVVCLHAPSSDDVAE